MIKMQFFEENHCYVK